MLQKHLDQLNQTVAEVKAATLNAKHLHQLLNIPTADRFIWTDKDIADAFVESYGGRVSDKHDTIPWRLLYDDSGEFVAYVKEYKIAAEVS